jgi:hypothetical protein
VVNNPKGLEKFMEEWYTVIFRNILCIKSLIDQI